MTRVSTLSISNTWIIVSKHAFFAATFPFGGVKRSGWGRNNAKWGLEEFTTIKLVTVTMEDEVAIK